MPKVKIDFSEAASGGNFRERHVEEGDYLFVVKSSEEKESKAGNPQIVFTVTSPQIAGASYPIYCPLTGKGTFKIRQLMEACGVSTAGKSAVLFDTDKLNGKQFGGTLLDDEYEGKEKSKIDQVFSASELEDGVAEPEEEEAPPVKTAAARKPAAKAESDEVDLDEI